MSHTKHKTKLNPDMVPYSHEPPGHTCGLPCCSEDLQVQLRKQRKTRSCIGIQDGDNDCVPTNFIFKGRMKHQAHLESGFFSVQDGKEASHAPIPKFGSVRETGLNIIQEERKSYPFIKGREITLPEAKGPNPTEKLYLEDYHHGESDDCLDGDNDLQYFMSYKDPAEPDKGVPYDPEDLETKQIYPWGMLGDAKDNVSTVTFSDRGEDSSSSCYYDVLQFNDGNSEPGSYDARKPPYIGAKPVNHDAAQHDQDGNREPRVDVPPPLPPKLPLKHRLKHSPLPPLPISDNGRPEPRTAPQTLECVKKGNTQCIPLENPSSGLTAYNMYSSVCSLNNMGNMASQEALARYRHHNQSQSSGHRTPRQDVRDYDFTGANTYVVNANMLHGTKRSENLSETLQRKLMAEAVSKNLETATHSDHLKANSEDEKGFSGDSAYFSGGKIGGVQKSNSKSPTTMDDEKLNLLDNMQAETGDGNDDDDDEDIRGIINPTFKNVNVDGKILGSRSMHSLNRVDTDEMQEDRDLQGLYRILSGIDASSDTTEDSEMMRLFRTRLQDPDSADTLADYKRSDLPVTLIL